MEKSIPKITPSGKQKTAYEIMPSLVGSEMCIRDRKYSCTAVLYIFSIPECALWSSFMILWTALGLSLIHI